MPAAPALGLRGDVASKTRRRDRCRHAAHWPRRRVDFTRIAFGSGDARAGQAIFPVAGSAWLYFVYGGVGARLALAPRRQIRLMLAMAGADEDYFERRAIRALAAF